MSEALIGMGANLGDARATLAAAVAAFCDGAEVRLVARSADYLTPPWGVEDQPPFVNLCLRIETALPPKALLRRALDVESRFGRDRARERRWGPRPLDIDILAYDELVLDAPELQLPHPRMKERAFVLTPLLDVAPEWRIGGETVEALAQRVEASGIRRLPQQTPRNGAG